MMKTRNGLTIFFILFSLFFLLFPAGCSNKEKRPSGLENIPHAGTAGCGYANFLTGYYAELHDDYKKALSAYLAVKKCDPETAIVDEKIPLILLESGDRERAITYLNKEIAGAPDSVVQRIILARLFIQEEQYEKAVALYQEVLQIAPDRNDISLRLAQIRMEQKKYDQAESLLQHILERDPTCYLAHLHLARLYLHTGKHVQAEKKYADALLINWSVDLLHELVLFYKKSDNDKKVEEVYQELIEYNPYDEKAQFGLIDFFLNNNKETEAIMQLEKLRNYSSNQHIIDILIGRIYLNQNKTEKAEKLFENLLDSPVSSEARFLLAIIHSKKDKQRALSYLKDIPGDSLNFEDAVLLQINLLLAMGKKTEAIQIAKNRISMEKERRPSFYAILAEIYEQQGKLTTSFEILEEGITRFPEDNALLFMLASLLEENGNYTRAIEEMHKILKREPDNIEALNFIGYIWADNDQNLAQALQYLNKANQLQPNTGYILDSLGWVHYKLGNLHSAEKYLRKALELDSEDALIFYHLGDTYNKQGEKEKAKKAYLQAIKIAPEKRLQDEIRKQLELLE